MSGNVRMAHSEARDIPLPDDSVQCVVTSPPYWGLRKYAGEQELIWGGDRSCESLNAEHEWNIESRIVQSGGLGQKSAKQHTNRGSDGVGFQSSSGVCARCGAWRGAYGLEPTIQMYVEHTVEILREIRRVLRPDGVLFWNIGDSYSSGGRVGHGNRIGHKQETNHGSMENDFRPECGEIKPKDLCLIPSRVAIAAQEDGWWVRSMIIWEKVNPMPESCTDRPTDATENIIMLAKSEYYYWDKEAVAEPSTSKPETRDRSKEGYGAAEIPGGVPLFSPGARTYNLSGTRNMRNVWTFPTRAYRGAHFATFPEELPRRCILAATSSKGACRQCGAPWRRVVDREPVPASAFTGTSKPDDGHVNAMRVDGERRGSGQKLQDFRDEHPPKTVGWTPTCGCNGQHGATRPCVVLDPFGGSGTTGRVAVQLNRDAVLCDIAYDAEYKALAEDRTTGVQRGMFT